MTGRRSTPGDGSDAIPLADEQADALPPRALPCRSCGRLVRWDEPICARCGHDRRGTVESGARPESAEDEPVCRGCGYSLRGNAHGRCPECGREHAPARPDPAPPITPFTPPAPERATRCPSCGYDLAGLPGPSPRCPECGASTYVGRRERWSRMAADEVRREDRKALVGLAIAVPITTLIALGLLGPDGLLLLGVKMVVEFPATFLIFMLCASWWIDVDGSYRSFAVRLLTVNVVADGATLLFAALPFPFLPPLVALIVSFLVGFQLLFDLDPLDTIFAGLVCLIPKVIVSVLVLLWFMGLL